MSADAPAVVGIDVADEPDAWRAAGFAVDGDRTQIGGIAVHLVGRGHGKRIRSWTWSGLDGDGDLDGLATSAGEPPAGSDTPTSTALRSGRCSSAAARRSSR